MTRTFVSWWWLMKRSRTGLIALLSGLFLFELIQPVAIASFGDLEQLQSILQLVPAPFLALLNVTPDFLEFAGLSGYISVGFTHPVYFLLSSAAVIWVAGRGLAGEMERGSIHLSLSRPMSRTEVYLARLLAVVTITFCIAVVGPAGTVAGIAISDPDGTMNYENLIPLAGASILLILAIGGVALLISAVSDTMSQALGWSIGLLVIAYVIDYFAELWSTLEPVEPFSVFDYYDPATALTQGSIPLTHVLVLAVLAILGAGSGMLAFDRRDLPG